MPFKSKAQQRWIFWAESQGKLPKGTAKEWADHTPDMKQLPEKVHDKAAEDLLAAAVPQLPNVDTGLLQALKTAVAVRGSLQPWSVSSLLKSALGPDQPVDTTMIPASQIPNVGAPQASAALQQQMPVSPPSVDPSQAVANMITPRAKPTPIGGTVNTPSTNPIGLYSGLSTQPGKPVDGNSAFGTRKMGEWRTLFGLRQ